MINLNSGLTTQQLLSLRKVELDAQEQPKEEVIAALLYVSRLLMLEQNLNKSVTDFSDRKIMKKCTKRDYKIIGIAKILVKDKIHMPNAFIMDSENPEIVEALKTADKILKYLEQQNEGN